MSDHEKTDRNFGSLYKSESRRAMQNNCQSEHFRLWSNFNKTRSGSTNTGPKFKDKNRNHKSAEAYDSRVNKGRKPNVQELTKILLAMANKTYWGTITDVTYNLINFKPEDTLGVMDLFDGLKRLCTRKTPFRNDILQSVVNQKFLISVQTFMLENIKDCTKTEKGCEQIRKFFEDFIQLSKFAAEVLPSRFLVYLKCALTLTRTVMENLEEKVMMKSVSSDIDKLFILIDEKSRREKSTNQDVSADEYNELKLISILPTRRDLFEEPPELKKNIIKGAYAGVDHYITVQFKLLREDFIAPLRDGITEYLTLSDKFQRKQSGVYFYHNVKILHASISSGKLGHVIQLDQKVNWRVVSQFFIFGSLLLFTTNNFNSFFLGTVIEVDNKNKTIIVKLNEMHNDVCNDIYAEEFTVAASKVFFEPYFHVLTSLKKMIMEEFPMEKYIVQVDPLPKIPIYIAEQNKATYQIFDEQVSILEPSWPKMLSSFNPSQYRAFQAALTSEFVAIQGPPGTGKTFLGLQIVTALLDNVNIDSPILVVCFKNHALDQFLEGILEKTKEIIRIGGRSQSEKLEDYNLKKRRARYGYREFAQILENLAKNYFSKQNDIKSLKTDGIVAVETLLPYISCTTTKWQMMKTNIVDWLMEGLYVKTDEPGNLSSQQGVFQGKDNSNEKRSEIQTYSENGINDINWHMEENRRRLDVMYIDDYSNEYHDITKIINEHHDGMTSQQPNTSKGIISVFAQSIYDLQTQSEIYKNRIKIISECIAGFGGEDLIYKEEQTMIMEAYRDNMDDLKARIQYLKRMLPRNTRMTEEQKVELYKISQLSVWSLTPQQRWMLYHSWVDSVIQGIKNEMRQLEESIQHLEQQLDEKRNEVDLEVLKEAKVVGLTTTAAAKLRPMLNKLGAKIVVIEEAAEVLESHIVTSLSSHCQHVILIGDHKQLRPNPAVYELCKKFNFDISLFERMVKNGLNCYQLDVQHRMRPEFASLIVPAVYSDLTNHSSTEGRPNILGVCHNLFFMDHNHPEEQWCKGRVFSFLGDHKFSRSSSLKLKYCSTVLGTFLVKIVSSKGTTQMFHALLDLIMEHSAQLLGTTWSKSNSTLTGLSQNVANNRERTLHLETLSGFLITHQHPMLILDNLTDDLPQVLSRQKCWSPLNTKFLLTQHSACQDTLMSSAPELNPDYGWSGFLTSEFLTLYCTLFPKVLIHEYYSLGQHMPFVMGPHFCNVVMGSAPCACAE
ncbi:NFX1-type zinc finger-containing protein 1 [Homalodisca vitripennis]|nr:NFX1-type zinc finger-containing protein 1 [Homalodisca vitripennis]